MDLKKKVFKMYMSFILVLSALNILLVVSGILIQRKMRLCAQQKKKDIVESFKRNERLMERSVMALSNAIEAKDSYTSGHSKRVASYVREIARRMGKDEDYQRDIYHAGLLHDIGKIRIPDRIISKKGKLSDMEFECLKLHPIMSFSMLRGISEDGRIETATKYHHEHFDGTGYPEGLAGKSIPEFARILAIADTYDAMTSSRSFRNLFPQKFVRSEIEYQMGKQFDPEIAKHMLDMIDEDKDFTLRQKDDVNKKILVVDDDVIAIKLVEFMLEGDRTLEITSVKTGEHCIKALEEYTFDLIILDIYLPDTDGFKIFDLIRDKYKTPVIFMSSDKNEETITRDRENGIKYYLVKPFLKQELEEALRDVFRYDLEP